jgi:hypothetical protein
MTDPRATHTAGREARARDVRAAELRSRSIGTTRVLVALVALAAVVLRVWGGAGEWAWGLFAACFVGFGALVVIHARVAALADRAAAALRFHERGLARLDDRWSDLPATGARFAREDHPYTDDLDVFGHASLFQRIDATETRFGEERLAAWLTAACEPVDLAVVKRRQEAVKDLAPRVPFRERLSAAGAMLAADKPDPAPFLAWAEGAMPLSNTALLTAVAWVLPSLLVLGITANLAFHVSAWAWGVPLLAELTLVAAGSPRVSQIAGSVAQREGAFARFGELIAAIEREPFEAPLLREVQATLRASGIEATREMARLERVLSFLEARNNEVWRLLIAPALLWDIHCVVVLERWRLRTGARVRAWLEAIGDVEALASLAGLAFERPDHAFPELVDAPRFEAEKLGHPLLAPGKRVDNDVHLAGAGATLVVTGSNMSGKSTLLRAIGTNAVLALAGGPVCARRMSLGPVRVAASMRVRDSLSEGVSRFYAEVRKLKAVIERARAGRVPATLFLLDEVLHGTNSRERLIGARAIVRELVARGALGAVSTHDLALGDLEQELAGSAVNVHFEEQVHGEEMTFDYVLRPGVVKSSNALRIMRMVGIDVVNVP